MSTIRSEPIVDVNQPASTLLAAGSMKLHEEIDQRWVATLFGNGELDREEYARYLMTLWRAYKVLEDGLATHADVPVLSPTYNPALLSRLSALSSDISFFLGVPDDDESWKVHQTYKSLISSSTPAFQASVSRLNQILDEDPRRLLAHSYVWYLGVLSGGQEMKRLIRKGYKLGDDDRLGTMFYDFGVKRNEGEANATGAQEIKRWFKNGIDAGVGDDIDMKEALLDEIKRAFFLQRDIIYGIGAAGSKEQKPEEKREESSKIFSMTSVLILMLAVGLAHFIVFGGLSGSRGYVKLEAAPAWVSSTFFLI